MDPEKLSPEVLYSENPKEVKKELRKLEEGEAGDSVFTDDGENTRSLKVRDLIKLSIRVFITRPSRTLLTILGMSLGVGVVLVLISLGYGLQYLLIGKIVTTEDSLITLEAYYAPESDLSVSMEALDKIKVFKGVKEISPVAEFPGEVQLKGATTSTQGFLLVRVVESNFDKLSGSVPDIKLKQNTREDHSGFVSASGLKLLNFPADETSLSKELNVNIFYPDKNEGEDTVRVASLKNHVDVAGIYSDETLPPFIVVPAHLLAQEDTPPFYQKVFVKAADVKDVELVRTQLVDSGFLVSSKIDMVNQVQRIMSIVTIILGIFGIAALLVSAIGMFNTMIISFLERIFEVGIMKALGATNRDIRNLFLMESFMMGFLGGLGGIIIGTLIGETLNLALNIMARSLGGKSVDIFIQPWWFMLLIVVISSLIGVFSGFLPARRAMKVSPQKAFKRG